MHHEDLEKVERVVFCSGEVFYDLDKYRKDNGITNTAIIRVEQLYPFHDEMMLAIVSQFSKASKFVWCQEEPKNMGAYTFIAHLAESLQTIFAIQGEKLVPLLRRDQRQCTRANKMLFGGRFQCLTFRISFPI